MAIIIANDLIKSCCKRKKRKSAFKINDLFAWKLIKNFLLISIIIFNGFRRRKKFEKSVAFSPCNFHKSSGKD